MNQKERVDKILTDLKKKIKIPASQVESELALAAGILWKVRNTDDQKWKSYKLPEDKMKELEEYHRKKMEKGEVSKRSIKVKKVPAPKKTAVKVVTPVIIKTPAQVPREIVLKKPKLSAYMLERQRLKSSPKGK